MTTERIYISHHTEKLLIPFKQQLEALGYEVTSNFDSEDLVEHVSDIRESDVFVLFLVGHGAQLNRTVEFGIAIGLEKVLVCIGDAYEKDYPGRSFVNHYRTTEQFLAAWRTGEPESGLVSA
jgi:hypothetical protein